MIYIEPESTDAAFHFAVEEFCMQHIRKDEPIWMLWHTDRCVMLGRNQIADVEIDMQAAKQFQVQVVRRSSGGGTIFADLNTLQYTLILPYSGEEDVQQVKRTHLADPMIQALNQMGIPVKWQGRNDIYLEGKKVSGLAQYIQKDRICSHGSLLYDTDLSVLTKVLRTDETKIQSKALRSMRSGVTTMKEYCDSTQSFHEFWASLKKILFQTGDINEYVLSLEDITEIQKIRSQKYADSDWLLGQTPRFSYHNQKRFPGGKIEVFLDVHKGMIQSCTIRGDFLGMLPVHELEAQMESIPYQYQAVAQVLVKNNLHLYFGSITREELLECLFET